jgi:arylsulfatase A-like enzyme
VNKFVTELKQKNLLDNTVLAVFSDHLAMRNTQWDLLKQNDADRRLSFFLLDGGEAQTFDKPATHFDVAPTLLDYIGIPGYKRLNAGRSLREGGAGSWFQMGSDARSIARSAIFTGRHLSLNGGFSVNYNSRSITVDGLEFKANAGGSGLGEEDAYGIIFDEAGNYEGIVSTPVLMQFLHQKDKLMVLLSRSPGVAKLAAPALVNQELDEGGGLYLFVGYPGQDSVVEKIWSDFSLNRREVAKYIRE